MAQSTAPEPILNPAHVKPIRVDQSASTERTVLENHQADYEAAVANLELVKAEAQRQGLPWVDDPHGPVDPNSPVLAALPIDEVGDRPPFPDRTSLTIVNPKNPDGIAVPADDGKTAAARRDDKAAAQAAHPAAKK